MDGSKDLLNNFFVSEVKKNLHIVLCFSPVGDAFRERLRKVGQCRLTLSNPS
jgi:dynein heavy chain